MDVLEVYCPSLILLGAISVPARAKYCSQVHHMFETVVGNYTL
jgi:hypothetical protein